MRTYRDIRESVLKMSIPQMSALLRCHTGSIYSIEKYNLSNLNQGKRSILARDVYILLVWGKDRCVKALSTREPCGYSAEEWKKLREKVFGMSSREFYCLLGYGYKLAQDIHLEDCKESSQNRRVFRSVLYALLSAHPSWCTEVLLLSATASERWVDSEVFDTLSQLAQGAFTREVYALWLEVMTRRHSHLLQGEK